MSHSHQTLIETYLVEVERYINLFCAYPALRLTFNVVRPESFSGRT